MSLKTQIDAFEVQKKANVPADILNLMDVTTEKLIAEQLSEHALKVGDKFPAFELPDSKGKQISSTELLTKGPLVLSFYRGGWCPYCNLELRALNNMQQAFADQNAQLVAVSPQLPDESLSTQQQNELAYTVLSDVSNSLAKKCGLVFTLDERLIPVYDQLGLDIPKANGDESYELPLPATYVIDSQGVIQFAFAHEDYTLRAEPLDVLNAVKALNHV
ncbi:MULTISPECIES: peroxiredoxin-like family protein [Pseudoalteromonas]|uniref:thioredoxin-dependent peroxiredoxin n=1 Tax=Pseudoalteromonas lipolytica TaxID=570156 RepID=A0ABU8SP91_9GAMM|nr:MULTISPECIES: peroxiredoxin-like family protein [unclassified Pseudoalteromonas]MAH27183.1 alkyl hydroperoxide reductase [Pseudoalteromonadaceae bacterium]NHH88667.1 putative peroxiredoxin [Pseudoalteromonas sp. MB47]